jgi:hypothetical protein
MRSGAHRQATGVAAMKITGSISRATALGQADKYKRFAEQCRELAKPSSGQLRQTLEEMAKAWDDLADQEDAKRKR